jgi:hypothetical protein
MVNEMQGNATHVAQRRGAFELNCPAATATVLSKEMSVSVNLSVPKAMGGRRAAPIVRFPKVTFPKSAQYRPKSALAINEAR